MKALKKSLLAIAYRKKYSFPDKVIYRKIGTSEKLTKLIKSGKSKIYLGDIFKSYEKAYLSKALYKDIKAYMEKLGYAPKLDPKGRIYYDLIDYVNGDPGSIISDKISNLEKLTRLIKSGKSKIYLSDIIKTYAKSYSTRLYYRQIKSYLERLGYVALLDGRGNIYYDLIDYINGDPGSIISDKISNLEKLSRLIKRGESKIYLSDIIKTYAKSYSTRLCYRQVKSYLERLSYVAQLDERGNIYYDLINYVNGDTGVITKKFGERENPFRERYSSAPLPENMHRDVRSCMRRFGFVHPLTAYYFTIYDIEYYTTNAVYRWRYSFPNKVITTRVKNLEKLSRLIKRGESKIYLSDIIKTYAKSYSTRVYQRETEPYMEMLGFIAQLDEKGKTYYNLIDYTRYARF